MDGLHERHEKVFVVFVELHERHEQVFVRFQSGPVAMLAWKLKWHIKARNLDFQLNMSFSCHENT